MEKHRKACAHRDEGECAYAGYLSLAFALGTHDHAEKHAQHKAEHAVDHVDFGELI